MIKSLGMEPILLCGDECYEIIGCCMEVHKYLGKGFLEIVYKEALQIEFQSEELFYEREKEYFVEYKEHILNHKFYADFVLMNKIILEVKAVSELNNLHVAQAINYLAVSKCKLALLVNFGAAKLEFKRILL